MDKKRSILIILILTALLSCIPFYALGAGESSQTDPNPSMDQLSEQLVQLTEQGKFAEAKQKLDQLSSLYTQVGAEKKLSIEALSIISDAVVGAKRTYAAVRPDKNAMIWHANQLRLLTDAITHPNQPMWKGYHSVFIDEINQMIAFADKRDSKSFTKEFEKNLNLYNLLKPCFAINQTPSTIEMMDSLYTFLGKRKQIQGQDSKAIHDSLVQLRQVSDHVFLGITQNTFGLYMSNNSPITMITIMGSILLTALTYVGWRMYRGTRYNV